LFYHFNLNHPLIFLQKKKYITAGSPRAQVNNKFYKHRKNKAERVRKKVSFG